MASRRCCHVASRPRAGFTLVEALVAFALILFIMVILTEAFTTALRAFRNLKALGDLEEQLRGAAGILRRDLAADHFEGRRRLSDPLYSWSTPWPPREGFFRIARRTGLPFQDEGRDADGLAARRSTLPVLHFSVKLRGNARQHFFQAQLPAGSPLRTQSTTFFNQAADARYQDTQNVYSSQWAEVAYFAEPNGTAAGATPLYTLYRSQFVVIADNRNISIRWSPRAEGNYAELSCQRDVGQNTDRLYFNTPGDLATPYADPPANRRPRRAFNPDAPTPRGATVLLTNVVSFDVQTLRVGDDFEDVLLDTAAGAPLIRALQVTLRVWDLKTQQTRQITVVQDL